MTADISLPLGAKIWMGTFRIPVLGRLFHSFKPTRMYSDITLKLVGFKDLVLANEIQNDSIDIKALNQLVSIFQFVKKSTKNYHEKSFLEINSSIDISLKAINEIIEIAEKKRKYDNLKSDLFFESSSSITANLNKYKQPAYEGK